MILERLNIRRRDFGEDTERFCGTVEFKGKAGDVSLTLTGELSARLLAVVAEELEAVGL